MKFIFIACYMRINYVNLLFFFRVKEFHKQVYLSIIKKCFLKAVIEIQVLFKQQ